MGKLTKSMLAQSCVICGVPVVHTHHVRKIKEEALVFELVYYANGSY